MPTYEYRCQNGHVFEVVQRMSDDPVTSCEQCGAPVDRVFHPVAVHFKGSGFYSTDYAGKEKEGASADGDKVKSGDSKSEKSEKSESTSDSKTDSKAGSEAKAKAGSGD